MAKIDTSTIEGYENMSLEEKIAALEAAEIPDPDMSGFVPKATFDKTASDLAALKREKTAQMSEEQRKAQEAAEQMQQLRDQVAALTAEKTKSGYVASFLDMGYPKDLAEATAQAMVDGDNATVFANQKTFLETYAKTVKAQQMKETPYPANGGSGAVDYQKMIDDAKAKGDFLNAAYYTRLAEEARITAKK